jgi:hypothetical protein
MVRIRRPEKSAPVNYSDNVTVGMPIDDETGAVYLRIVVNKKVYFQYIRVFFFTMDDLNL